MHTPTLSVLPLSTVIWGGIGYLYGKVTQKSPTLTAQVLAIWAIADTMLFFLVSHHQNCPKELKSIYSISNLIVNSAVIFTLKQLELINNIVAVALSSLTIFTFYYRC